MAEWDEVTERTRKEMQQKAMSERISKIEQRMQEVDTEEIIDRLNEMARITQELSGTIRELGEILETLHNLQEKHG